MVSLKVWNGSALKDPDMIIAKGSTDTLFEVNYVVVNNSSQNPVTVWQAISQTTRSTTTTFDTSQSTTTTFDTSNATTTTFSTSNSTTTTFNTSNSTTTSFNTTRSTTTSFNTSRSTTTSFNTSRSTTTSFNTSRSTSRTTNGSYTPYYVSAVAPYYGLTAVYPYPTFWNSTSAIFMWTSWNGSSGATISNAGYTYQVSTSPPIGGLMYTTLYKVRRYLGPYSTSYTTTFGTSKSTTTTFGTSRSTTTTFGTSNSTTTTFGTSNSTTTTFSTNNSTTTTFDTTNSTTTTFSTNNATTTTFSTNNATDTTIFVRLTGTVGGATSTETEVASADATNVRYWDGDSWEED